MELKVFLWSFVLLFTRGSCNHEISENLPTAITGMDEYVECENGVCWNTNFYFTYRKVDKVGSTALELNKEQYLTALTRSVWAACAPNIPINNTAEYFEDCKGFGYTYIPGEGYIDLGMMCTLLKVGILNAEGQISETVLETYESLAGAQELIQECYDWDGSYGDYDYYDYYDDYDYFDYYDDDDYYDYYGDYLEDNDIDEFDLDEDDEEDDVDIGVRRLVRSAENPKHKRNKNKRKKQSKKNKNKKRKLAKKNNNKRQNNKNRMNRKNKGGHKKRNGKNKGKRKNKQKKKNRRQNRGRKNRNGKNKKDKNNGNRSRGKRYGKGSGKCTPNPFDIQQTLSAIGFSSLPTQEVINKAECIVRSIYMSLEDCASNILAENNYP